MIAGLRAAFTGRLLTDEADMAPFLEDWRKLWRGRALAVAQPDTTEDVAAVVRWCAANAVPIVPLGGNTGMSGGATPDDSGRAIVLSLARMNRIRALDPINNTVTLDAGCILQTVQDAAEAAGKLFPLSLAAEGSCTIGGNLATNAGGTAVLRYGTARELCLGLEVVTAAGEIWDGLKGLRKDNTGYDLRDLFVGSEGTLGIITGAVVKLFARPAATAAAIVALDSPEDALALFDRARSRAELRLTAFEIFSEQCLSLVLSHFPDARRPVETTAPWYALIEFADLVDQEAARADLEAVLTEAFEAGRISDAALADTIAQARAFWALRENIAEAQGAEGKTIKHDIALPLSSVPAFLRAADAAVAARWPDMRFVVFGHMGDGNLHYNFSPAPGADQAEFVARQDALNHMVHDIVRGFGGSISAEHGLGMLRHLEADRFRSPVERRLQRAIKDAFDPAGILNPGKMMA